MTNLYSPVAIYAWENEKCKNIPCIENFDILFKLYNCHVEDLYILKQIDFSDLQVRENSPEYGTYRSLVTLQKKVDVLDINQLKENMDLLNEILRDGIKIYR